MELRICKRLREIREAKRYSLSDFAALLGITKDRLASYEYGRAPIRYWLADKVCSHFDLNQRWFYYGRKPGRNYMRPGRDLSSRINSEDLFTSVYNNQLSDLIEGRLTQIANALGCSYDELDIRPDASVLFANLGEDASTSEDLYRALCKWFEWHTKYVPPELRQQYFRAVVDASGTVMERREEIIERYFVQVKDQYKDVPFPDPDLLFKAVKWPPEQKAQERKPKK